ncbi:unnamed protein product [Allacma fusca]|uniref:Syndecan n=1 Tax=Allacma fusca TaxID=39272 RepID=A0A8J2JJI9_9HEXA|nr:unnamed protein product [Allacma fusca]
MGWVLSEKIDQDLFLEDEPGSGGGRPDDDGSSGDRSIDEDDDPNGIVQVTPKKPDPNVGFENTPVKPEVGDPIEVDPEQTEDVFNKKDTPASFFSQPGILAAIICGAIVGLLCAILLVMFIVYRMRKKDEGSYVLDDSKRTATTYGKSKEFYA